MITLQNLLSQPLYNIIDKEIRTSLLTFATPSYYNLCGDINTSMARDVLAFCNKQKNEAATLVDTLKSNGISCEIEDLAKDKSIIFNINSGGGEMYAALGIHDCIKQLPFNVYIVGSGLVGSAALHIFLAVKQRRAEEHTTFLIHQCSGFAGGYLNDMKENVEESQRVMDIFDNIVVSNTKITKEFLKEIYGKKKDYFFDCKKAIDLGILMPQ